VQVSKCSVDPTSKGCQPTVPQAQCPMGQGDSNRQELQFTFTILCSGSNTVHQETDYGCTKDEALMASKNKWWGSACGPVGMGVLTSPDSGGTAPPAPECPNGATKQDFKVCLMCGTTNSTLSFKACSSPDAQDAAELN